MKNAVMFYNPARPKARGVMLEAAEILHRAGVRICLPNEYTDDPYPSHFIRMDTPEAIEMTDIAVVIGGDGSILRVAEYAARNGVPLIGINMGRLGFMSELEPDEVGMLAEVTAGRFTLDRRMMLEAQVLRGGRLVMSGHALNDVVLYRGEGFKLLDLDIYADRQFITQFRADGVIIATPTGTTAYSMSAGGPIIEPGEHNMTITPICAHGLYAKSFVLAPHRIVTINTSAIRSKTAYLSVDGKAGFNIWENDVIVISQSSYCTDLIRIKGKSVYDVIRDKLNYGN